VIQQLADRKDILNLKIKRRESLRPFAPSVLREHLADWFELDGDVPPDPRRHPRRQHRPLPDRVYSQQRRANGAQHLPCTPRQALDCFLRTRMDVLVLGDVLVRRG